jgi:GNAT superfamily N-acetyltransferase
MTTIEVRELETPAPAVFGAMTFPAYRHLLSLGDKGTRHLERDDRRVIRPLALAAWQGSTAVGLVLAELPVALDGSAPQLLSTFVVPELRDKGIGTAMVRALETEIRKRGFDYVETVYMTGRPGTEAIERVLKKLGWTTPVARTVTVRFYPTVVAAKPWFDEVRRSAPDCEIFPWTELSVEERDEIRRSNQEEHWIPAGREPWAHDLDGFDPIGSVGLRQGGHVIGWVITHQVGEEATRFSCMFAREPGDDPRLVFPLLAESIGRLAAADVKICTFVVPAGEARLTVLVIERCPDAVEFFGETRGSSKWLSEDTPEMGA